MPHISHHRNSRSPVNVYFSQDKVYKAAEKGETAVYRNIKYAAALTDTPGDVRTLYENFQRGIRVSGDLPCLGTRVGNAYQWITYKQVAERLGKLGAGFAHLGLNKGDFVGIISANRAEWVITEQACNAYGLPLVPLYDTLGPDAVSFIVNETQLTLIVTSAAKLGTVLDAAKSCLSLRHIIVMETSFPAPAAGKVPEGVQILTMDAVEKLGAANPSPPRPPAPADLATICYTSGTTGNPKGAMLSHANFAASLSAIINTDIELTNTDIHVSYLPLAHMFERIVQLMAYYTGARVGFFSGDVAKLLEDLSILQPTIFPSVPRLFNRIYDKLVQGVSAAGGAKQALFNYAFSSKSHYLHNGGHTQHALWDKLVFGKLRALLGGRVRIMITGSAPISGAVKDFLQVAFCCPVLEGYGLTETCAIGTVTPTVDRAAGHVGAPVSCCELKLVDLPDMNYLSTDQPYPRGEICFRGPNVFVGYFKSPEKTAECLEANGWFHTGDVGRINANGTVSIIDRKKNIFKLAQGEYVAPEKIENIYARSPLVAQCFVYGSSLESCLVAVVVPDPEVVATWAKQHNVQGDFKALCASDTLRAAIFEDMRRVAAEAKLLGFETARAIALDPEPFSVENGLLTPTFKLKRQQLQERYEKEVTAMYAALPKQA